MFKVLQFSSLCVSFLRLYVTNPSLRSTCHQDTLPRIHCVLRMQFLRMTHTDLWCLNLLKTKQSNTLQAVLSFINFLSTTK